MPTRALTPTLTAVALALCAGGPLAAATAGERDQHFAAVQVLIDKGLRLPGERQLAEFAKAAYPDDAWHRKALAWLYAERFKAETTDAAKAKTLEQQSTALRNELDAAEKAGSLPEAVKAMLAGAGDPTVRTVNELARIVSPDGPKPLVAPAPEKLALLKRQVQFLVENTPKRFNLALAKIKANEAKEKGMWDLPERDPKAMELIKTATFLRADALRALYVPHIVLREVVTRGEDFGLDPKPVAQMWGKLLKENAKAIEDWDYQFGDYYPPLKVHANVLLGEALRQKVAGTIELDPVEAELFKVIDMNLGTVPASARDGLIDLQLKTWTSLLKLRLELGGERNLLKGVEHWRQCRERLGDNPALRLAQTNVFSQDLGGLYIAAARLLAARGDNSGAQALLGEVSANRRNPQAENAVAWLRQLGGESAGTGDGWGQPPAPQDPGLALSVALALMRSAGETADAKLAQSQYLAAAVQLRAGAMGFGGEWAGRFVELGPELYGAYSLALNKLDLRIHAALVAGEGLRAAKARIDADPKANPWRSGAKGEWNEAGRKLAVLARNTMIFAGNLSSRLKGPGVQALAGDLLATAKAVAPEEFGKGFEWLQIVAKLSERDWDGAIDLAGKYRKAHPEESLKAFSVVTNALMGRYEQMRAASDKPGMARAADDMRSLGQEIQAHIDQALKRGNLDGEQKRDLEKARNTIESSQVQILLGDEKFAEVLKRLGPDYWKNPPADESLLARMLRNLAQAAQRQERERIKDEARKGDAKALLAQWPAYRAAYETYTRLVPRVKDPDEQQRTRAAGRLLADLFSVTGALADGLKARPGAPDGLDEVSSLSKRYLADLLEPGMGADEKPANLLAVASVLWDLDEHARAVRLLALYRDKAGEDPALKAFKERPAGVLDPVEAVLAQRPEFKQDWALVRDLIEDKPSLRDQRAQGVPRKDWDEQPADLGRASAELRKLRARIEDKRLTLGEVHTKAMAAINALDAVLQGALRENLVAKRLAQGWRETGKGDQARDLYLKLYETDPDDPVVATAVVDITVDQVKKPGPAGAPGKADLEKALDISKRIRDDAGKDQYLFWTAAIQTYELSAALGGKDNLDYINRGLKFDAVNQSDPSWTLVSPRILPDARQAGDLPSVRRAANPLAVELGRRYLALYELPGVTQKAPYTLREIELDGRAVTLFVPKDAPPLVAREVVTDDEREVWIISDEASLAAFAKARDERAAAATAAADKPAAAATAAKPK